MVGDDRTTSEVSRLVSQLPPAVQALTGIDLSKVSNEPKSQNLKKKLHAPISRINTKQFILFAGCWENPRCHILEQVWCYSKLCMLFKWDI